MLIVKGEVILERYLNDIPDDYLLATSDTGYTNDEISVMWARHFVQYSKPENPSEKRLLLFDGFDSHCTREFLEILEHHDVIPYRLPSHTSHFLQPLDVGCFQPYKHWHAEAVDAATRTGCTNYNKSEFLAAIESIRAFTFKKETIRKGWKDTGLWPLNWSKISSKIAQLTMDSTSNSGIPEVTPEATPEATPEGTPELETPQTIRTLQRNVDICLDQDINLDVRRTLVGALRISVAGDQAIGELTTMTSIAQTRRQRQTQDRRQVDTSMGVIYSYKARALKQGRLQAEIRNLIVKNDARKRMPVGAKIQHFKAYKPIHAQLELVWASMRSAGLFAYEEIS
jgi:hypothetical protein